MRIYPVGLLALALATAASAADWTLVSTAADGMRTYLDVSTVTTDGNYRTTWEKAVNAVPDKSGMKHSVGHWRYNCSSRTYTLLSYNTYDASGTLLASQQVPTYSQELHDIAPDTVAETMLKFVCNLSG